MNKLMSMALTVMLAGCASRTEVMAGEYERLIRRGIPPETARAMVLTNEQNTWGARGGGSVYVENGGNPAMENFNAIRARQRR